MMRRRPFPLFVTVATLAGFSACQRPPAELVPLLSGRGELIELPLGPALFADFPPNHSNEPSIAARNGRVVVAYRNVHYLSPDTYADDPAIPFSGRQVGVATSIDGGDTFSLSPTDSVDGEFSDPVVRVG